jgi:hypothetical protein
MVFNKTTLLSPHGVRYPRQSNQARSPPSRGVVDKPVAEIVPNSQPNPSLRSVFGWSARLQSSIDSLRSIPSTIPNFTRLSAVSVNGGPTAECQAITSNGGRSWWAHLQFTRINIELTILRKKIEDLREAHPSTSVFNL